MDADATVRDRETSYLKELKAPVTPLIRRSAGFGIAQRALWIPQAYLLSVAVVGLIEGSLSASDLTLYAAGLVLLAALRSLCGYVSERLASQASLEVRRTCRRNLLQVLASDRRTDHAVEEAPTDFVEAVEGLDGYISRFEPLQIVLTVAPLVLLFAIAVYSQISAAIVAISLPFIPIFMALIGSHARQASEKNLEELADANAHILDRVSGLTTIRLFAAERRVGRLIGAAGERLRKSTMAVLRIAFLSSAVLELLAAFGVAFVAMYIGFNLLGIIVIGGQLTLQEGLFVLMLAPDVFEPFRSYASAYHDRASALASAGRLSAYQQLPTEQTKQVEPTSVSHEPINTRAETAASPALLHIQSPRVRPAPNAAIISFPIDLTLKRGESLALTGASGAGKSTLLRALLGERPLEEGEVKLETLGLTPKDGDLWRWQLSYVSQTPGFQHGSVLENLRLANPDTSETDIWQALEEARVRDAIEAMPLGLRSRIGEAGIGLSGGEQRRLSIARAFLKPAAVLLADEPTADLDETTAELVRASLKTLGENRIVVMATHDKLLVNQAHYSAEIKDNHDRSCDPAEANT